MIVPLPLRANSDSTTLSKRIFLIISSAVVYALLISHGNMDWHLKPFPFLRHEDPILRAGVGIAFAFAMLLATCSFYLADLSDWLYVMLCFVPFEFTKPFLSMPAFTPLDYLCVCAILAMLFRFPYKTLWHAAVETFGSWGLAAWLGFWGYCVVAALLEGGNPRSGLRWVGFCFCYFIAVQVKKGNPFFRKNISTILMCLGTGVALSGIIQFLHRDTYVQLEALFGQHNIFAAFLSFCLPATFVDRQLYPRFLRRMGLLCLSVMLAAFTLAYSRGAWVGVFVGISALLEFDYLAQKKINLIHKDWAIAIGLGLLALCVLVVRQPTDRGLFSDSGRELYLKTGKQIFFTHPWIGLGPGRYADKIHSYIPPTGLSRYETDSKGRLVGYWTHLHNLYLQVLVDYGLIGFFLWGTALGLCIYPVWRSLRMSVHLTNAPQPYFLISIVAFLVHNCVDIITVNSFDMVFGILLAITTFFA